MTKQGFFITIEGAEGAGKSTQIALLKEYLEEKYSYECVLTREPGGTMIAEKLRDIVKYCQDEEICDEAELMLFNAARAQHVFNLIRPAVQDGKAVICDRFYDSTTVYQGYARGLDLDSVNFINSYAVGDCRPDLTIVLNIDTEAGFQRVNSRAHENIDVDRFEQAGGSFHEKVRKGFLTIAELEPERVKVVDAANSIEEVHANVREVVDEFISKL
ncbi:dTMP kinase [Lentisphaerota bacterium WC36G]|nr:dTMP kinase [Lentisphaerae bacterium WC36]